jgi:hypothetical protein
MRQTLFLLTFSFHADMTGIVQFNCTISSILTDYLSELCNLDVFVISSIIFRIFCAQMLRSKILTMEVTFGSETTTEQHYDKRMNIDDNRA